MFDDEPDEPDEPEQTLADRFLHHTEPDEENRPQQHLFQVEENEPDEGPQFCVRPEGPEEPDEPSLGESSNDSASDVSAYEGDVDETVSAHQPIFEMGFQVMNQFLASQLGKVSPSAKVSVDQPKKKRCYNNSRRAAKAAAAKALKPTSTRVRLARNNPETSLQSGFVV